MDGKMFYSPLKNRKITIEGDSDLIYVIEANTVSLSRADYSPYDTMSIELSLENCTMTVKAKQEEEEVPELYREDLVVLTEVFDHLETLSQVSGVFAVEIRVKAADVNSWAVIGWSESGDPAILRFEQDESH